jgi:elongation factor G
VKDRLGANPVPIQLPIGAEENFKGIVDLIENIGIVWNDETKGAAYTKVPVPKEMEAEVAEYRKKLVEAAAEFDEALMEKFFEDENSITPDELIAALRKATLAFKITPMLCGSAFKNKGVQTLLDAVIKFLPSPIDVPSIEGINPKTGNTESRGADDNQPFAGLAFKIMTDPHVGRLAFFRVYSGKLEGGSYVLNTRTGNKERISRLLQMHANNRSQIDVVYAGDIAAAVGFKEIRTGDTLTDLDHPIVLESMTFPEPVIEKAVEPKTQADSEKLSKGLHSLSEEDPTFRVKIDEESGQTIIAGMGELHLEIIVDRLRREFKVEVSEGQPQVSYRETITKSIAHREKYAKQTGGRGKFADIEVEIGPGDGEKDFEFLNEIKGGVIPREYIPSVEKGIKNALNEGVLAGFPTVNIKARLYDGSFHAVDSDSLSFELCGRYAFREAARKANPILLEPIMKVEVVTPEEYMGPIVGDLNKRRGQINSMDARGNAKVINAYVPLSEMFGYVTQLRTPSSGRAASTMEFYKYEPAPPNVQKAVVDQYKGVKEKV